MQKFEIENHEYSLLPEGKKWKLAWHDEFDGDALDESKWNYRLNFWGKRFPAYCDKGVSLDGKGNAVFRPVKTEDGRICSSQLQTGSNSFDIPKENYDFATNAAGDNHFWQIGRLPKPCFMHRYGYYEVRCKLQKTDGWWSAFWLQANATGTTYDPEWSGVEVDVMEYFGGRKLTSGNFYGGYGKDLKNDARVHYDLLGNPLKGYDDNPQSAIAKQLEKAENEFHRFGVLWTENEYVFYFDGKKTAQTNKPVSQVPQFILLTTEVGGYRHGDGLRHDPNAENSLGDSFTVDYVRVFDEAE